MVLTESPTVLILGGDINALGHARALRQSGATLFCAVSSGQMSYGAATRYAKQLRVPNPSDNANNALEALTRLGRQHNQKPILLFANDAWLHLFIEHEQRLRTDFTIPYDSAEQLRSILYKDSLYELARHYNIPIPLTWRFANGEELLSRRKDLVYPSILKPSQPGQTNFKVIRFANEKQLLELADVLHLSDTNAALVAQEFIPGGAECLYTLTSYSDRQGKMLAGSVGHKERQCPPQAGVITAGRLKHVPEVFDAGQFLLDSLRFHGLANTEFKYDARDGQYKLVEINPRLGVWNSSVLAAGMNLALAAYNDMRGVPYDGPRFTTENDGLLWMNSMADFATHVVFRRKYYPDGGGLRVLQWCRQLRKPWCDGMLAIDDPGPAIAFMCMGISRLIRRGTQHT